MKNTHGLRRNRKFQSGDEELNKVVRQLSTWSQKVVVQAPSNKDSTIDELGGDEEGSGPDAIPTENEQPESKQTKQRPDHSAKGAVDVGVRDRLLHPIGDLPRLGRWSLCF